jgi:F0F1-type ATP synthase delta subunit
VLQVDPSIIGGIVIDVGDKHLDLSLLSRVKQLERLILAGPD